MKYLRNGQNSGPMSPLWPMMRGYGLNPFDPGVSFPTAGPGGGYEPLVPTMMIFEGDTSSYVKAPTSVSPFVEPPKTPKTLTQAPATGTIPGASETVSEAPTGAGVPEAAPETVHPYEEGGGMDLGPGTVDEGDEAHPEVEATPGGPAPTGTIPAGEYVGGTELGPEAGYEMGDEEKSRWPIYVGVGAGVGLLVLLGLAAWGGKKR